MKDYQYYKQRKLCTSCHRKDSRTISGKSLCIACNKRQLDYSKTRRLIRAENRICIECGKPLPEKEQYKTCFSCRIFNAERCAEYRERKKAGRKPMNARKLKQAFIQMLPVFTTDKDNPIKNGYIKTVIFTLGSSGKVRCDAEVQDLDSAKNFSKTPCRRIHLKSDDVKIKDAAASTNEHAESVKKAFVNVEPVIADVPGMNVVKCSHIIAIVYTRGQRGNIICSAILQDANCPSSTLQVRIKYIFTPSEYENIEKEH